MDMENDKQLAHLGMMKTHENVEKIRTLVRKDLFVV
jgi:hypothetical protein